MIYCDECKKEVGFNVENKLIVETINNIEVEYEGIKTYCKECGNELVIDFYDDQNTMRANAIYREKMNIISIDELIELTDKYNIGDTNLSLLLGWGRVTITRYKKGQTPSKKYSDILYNLLNYPDEMYKLLEENKERADLTQIAYKKCLAAIKALKDNEIGATISGENTLDLVVAYILSKKQLTPKALQKVIYFIQGFSKAFNKEFLFFDTPKAWVHGPVYENIYRRYKSYGYNPIVQYSSQSDNYTFSQNDKLLIDNILKYIGCLTGDMLEEITHNEMPWREARIGLQPNDLSSKEISLENIEEYFVTIKKRYNMMNYHDVRDYINDMIEKSN